ncbi:hypothetical protein MRB53_002824 [Persea americana]|uniref:Uncharacterized protein n=1 Tax=Persea americana TaxID=3435 RepID=A0ACC2MVU4_PERAE|nr:hypothetical protein MRB53_002824 [Persea americana]
MAHGQLNVNLDRRFLRPHADPTDHNQSDPTSSFPLTALKTTFKNTFSAFDWIDTSNKAPTTKTQSPLDLRTFACLDRSFVDWKRVFALDLVRLERIGYWFCALAVWFVRSK